VSILLSPITNDISSEILVFHGDVIESEYQTGAMGQRVHTLAQSASMIRSSSAIERF
jgi:hypothetical protein